MDGFTRKINQSLITTLMILALSLGAALASSLPGSDGSTPPNDTTIIVEDTTIAGDLVIDGAKTMMIENCSLDIEGRVTISGAARLTLRNAEMRLVEPDKAASAASGYWFDVQGNSSLEMVNVSIETAYFQGFRMRVSDSAKLRFRGVYSMDWYGLTCGGGSTVAVEDSTCWSMFNMDGHSSLSVSGSRVYGVNVTDRAEARLDGVYANTASVSGCGSLLINNSTIGSETGGLLLGFDEGTELNLAGFPASPTGIDFWHCGRWSLQRHGVTGLNVTLTDVYFRKLRLNVGTGADVRVIDVDAPVEIVCNDDSLTVRDSSIEGVRLGGGCAFSAENVSLSWLEAWTGSSADLRGAMVHRSESHNDSVVSYSSSTVGSLRSGEGAVILLCDSSLPEQLQVGGDSVVIHSQQPVSATLLGYDAEEGVLGVWLDGVQLEAELTVVLDRERVRRRSELDVLLDGEHVDYGVVDEKDLSYISIRLSPGVSHLSVDLGSPPPERLPFLETLEGQRLVTLLLILLLVVFVLLTWR